MVKLIADSTGNPHPDQLTHYDIEGDKVQPVTPDSVIGMAIEI